MTVMLSITAKRLAVTMSPPVVTSASACTAAGASVGAFAGAYVFVSVAVPLAVELAAMVDRASPAVAGPSRQSPVVGRASPDIIGDRCWWKTRADRVHGGLQWYNSCPSHV
jgi:hypothetical protein